MPKAIADANISDTAKRHAWGILSRFMTANSIPPDTKITATATDEAVEFVGEVGGRHFGVAAKYSTATH